MKIGRFYFFLIMCVLFVTSCENNLTYHQFEKDKDDAFKGFENKSPFTYYEDDDTNDSVTVGSSIESSSGIYAYEEDCIYFHFDKLYRYIPETGIVSLLCPDSVCLHNTPECAMYGCTTTDGLYFEGNDMFFRETYFYLDSEEREVAVNQYVKYNFENGNKLILETVDEGDNYSTSNMIFCDGYRYYTDIEYNEENKDFTFSFRKQDVDSGDVTVIKDYDSYVITPIMANNNKLYLYDNISNALYSLSDDMKEEQLIVENGGSFFLSNGEFIYLEPSSDYTVGKIMKCDSDGSNKKSLGVNNVSYIYVTNNYIYYSVCRETVKGEYERNGVKQYAEIMLNSIYRMKHDGSEKEVIFEPINTDEELFLLSDFAVLGRYIYSKCTYINITDGIFNATVSENENVLLRYDTVSGDVYYIHLDK